MLQLYDNMMDVRNDLKFIKYNIDEDGFASDKKIIEIHNKLRRFFEGSFWKGLLLDVCDLGYSDLNIFGNKYDIDKMEMDSSSTFLNLIDAISNTSNDADNYFFNVENHVRRYGIFGGFNWVRCPEVSGDIPDVVSLLDNCYEIIINILTLSNARDHITQDVLAKYEVTLADVEPVGDGNQTPSTALVIDADTPATEDQQCEQSKPESESNAILSKLAGDQETEAEDDSTEGEKQKSNQRSWTKKSASAAIRPHITRKTNLSLNDLVNLTGASRSTIASTQIWKDYAAAKRTGASYRGPVEPLDPDTIIISDEQERQAEIDRLDGDQGRGKKLDDSGISQKRL